MSADIIQAQYEQLEALARRFGKQADLQAALQKRVRTTSTRLQAAWVGRGSDAFYAELDSKVFPAMARLIAALQETQKVTLQMGAIIREAEEEAAKPFKNDGGLLVQAQVEPSSDPSLFLLASLEPAPLGPPPVPVPGDPTQTWKWNPNPQNSRGGSWGPNDPIPGQGQPSASWDPEGHWDVDDGKGHRQRHDKDGKPISPKEAHGKTPDPAPSKLEISQDLLERARVITGLTGAALIIYLIISEGSRVLFPLRNLAPIP